MAEKGTSFEEERLSHAQQKYKEAGCAPDGTPLDPKSVTPRDVRAAGGYENFVSASGGGVRSAGESPAVRVEEVSSLMAEKRVADEKKVAEAKYKRELKKFTQASQSADGCMSMDSPAVDVSRV